MKPDLTVDGNDITFSRDAEGRSIVGVGEPITVSAIVYNNGMAGTNQTVVWFYHDMSPLMIYDPSELIGIAAITDYIEADGGLGVASIIWKPESDEVGTSERIVVVLDPENIIAEINETMEDNSDFNVVDITLPPDLSIISVRFNTPGFQNVDNATEETTVTIRVRIYNTAGTAPAKFINVTAYDENPLYGGELIGFFDMGQSELIPDRERTVDILWDTSGETIGSHFVYVYVEDHTLIGDYEISDQNLADNEMLQTIYIHTKPDLRPIVLPTQTENIQVFRSDGTEITDGGIQVGQSVTVQATIYNDGKVYIPAVNVSFWNGDPEADGEQLGNNVSIQLTPNDYQNASVKWIVDADVGPIEIYVWVNMDGEVPESNITNNMEYTDFEIQLAPIFLSFTPEPKSKYGTGDTIEVNFRVNYTGTDTGVENLPYTLTVYNALNEEMYSTPGTLNNLGNMYEEVTAPDIAGDYYIEVEVTYGGGTYTSPRQYFSTEAPPEEFLPWWMIVIILISAILAVLLVGIFLARYGLGKLVECGECGAFIPEGEKKCPKCGAVFETDTAKCSECGAWIPVTSKSCPECGAIFAGIEKEKKDYIERMKLQYAEYVDQFRDEAKDDLGEAMTDDMFMDWWKASPKYVGFEAWLEREEELRKGKIYKCPECGTTNPISATICFKCGTVFKKEEEEEELPGIEEPPAVPPAEVPAKTVPTEPARQPPAQQPPAQRRAAPPTVVPKKVVQQPPTVVPKKVVQPPGGRPPTVVPKKVVKRPVEEEK
ncbi:MAG: CARDB domain-containing protein [Candidatus Hermodarchaeia archaeon]